MSLETIKTTERLDIGNNDIEPLEIRHSARPWETHERKVVVLTTSPCSLVVQSLFYQVTITQF